MSMVQSIVTGSPIMVWNHAHHIIMLPRVLGMATHTTSSVQTTRHTHTHTQSMPTPVTPQAVICGLSTQLEHRPRMEHSSCRRFGDTKPVGPGDICCLHVSGHLVKLPAAARTESGCSWPGPGLALASNTQQPALDAAHAWSRAWCTAPGLLLAHPHGQPSWPAPSCRCQLSSGTRWLAA